MFAQLVEKLVVMSKAQVLAGGYDVEEDGEDLVVYLEGSEWGEQLVLYYEGEECVDHMWCEACED